MLKYLASAVAVMVLTLPPLSCKSRNRSSLQADPQGRQTLSAREMNWAFLSRYPKAWGQENLFFRAHMDPNFANAHAQVIASDPVVRKAAEEGLTLWEEYRNALKEDFTEERVSTVMDPDSAMIRSLFALQPENTGVFAKLSLLELRTLAWDHARKVTPLSMAGVSSPSELSTILENFALPADKLDSEGETFTAEQVRSALQQRPETRDLSEADAALYVKTLRDAGGLQSRYERALFAQSDDKSALFAEKSTELQEWLDYQLTKVLDLMNANFQGILKREAQLRESLVATRPDIHWVLESQYEGIKTGKLVAKDPNLRNAFEGTFEMRSRSSPLKVLLNSKEWPTKDQETFAKNLLDVAGKVERVEVFKEIEFYSENFNLRYRAPQISDLWNRVNTMEGFYGLVISKSLSMYLSHAGERHNSLARTFKTLTEAKKSLQAMQTLNRYQKQNFMTSLVQKLVRGFRENQENPRKYSEYQGKNWTETVRSAGLVDRKANLMDGLYLRGLFESLRYWQFRDLLALSSRGPNLNDFLTGKAKAGSPTLARIHEHWLSSSAPVVVRNVWKGGKILGKISLPIALFTAMVMNPWNLDSVVNSIRDWGNGMTQEKVDLIPPWRNDSDTTTDSPFSGVERSSPTNVDLRGKGEQKALFSFSTSSSNLIEIPRYINFAFAEHTLERNYALEHIPNLSYERSDFEVQTDLPVLAQDHGLSLPSFSDQKLVWLNLFADGQRVWENEYSIHRNKDLNLYWIELESDKYEGSLFDYRVAYKELDLPPPDPNHFKLQTNLILRENKDLHTRGFHSLSASIRELTDPKSAETPLYVLADAYAGGAVYTGKPESYGISSLLLPPHYTNNYLKFLQDGCLYYQCSASNSFFVDFVQRVQQESSDSSFKIETIAGYYREDGASSVTRANSHLHTVAYAQQGGILELDATPSAEDDSMESNKVVVAAKKEALRPIPKRKKVPIHHMNFEINVWTPAYEERFRRATEIASATQDAKETLSTYGEYPKFFYTVDTQTTESKPATDTTIAAKPEESESLDRRNVSEMISTLENEPVKKPGELSQEEKQSIQDLKAHIAAIDAIWNLLIYEPQAKKLIEKHGASFGVFNRVAVLTNAYKAYLAGYLDLNSFRNLLLSRSILKSGVGSINKSASDLFQLAVKNISEDTYLRPLFEDSQKNSNPRNQELTTNRILELQKVFTSFNDKILAIQAKPLDPKLRNFVSPCITINLPGIVSQ